MHPCADVRLKIVTFIVIEQSCKLAKSVRVKMIYDKLKLKVKFLVMSKLNKGLNSPTLQNSII